MTDNRGFFVGSDIGELAKFLVGEQDPQPMTKEEHDENVGALFGKMNNMVIQGQAIIEECFNNTGWEQAQSYEIDEVALLAHSGDKANEHAVEMSALDVVTMFNSAKDHVHVHPFGTHYDVQYRFLQNSLYPWRVELMNMVKGVSPLHAGPQSMAEGDHEGMVPIHLSFKVPTSEEYDRLVASLATNPEWLLGQMCTSSYGRFSYWRYVGDGEGSDLWIKPRVNIRDQVGTSGEKP